jgi:hypothetical protein
MPIQGVKLCGRKKRDGSLCEQPAMANGACKMHGGKSLAGIASPVLTRQGRYSKHLPVRLKEQFEQAVGDGELLALREDIALLDSRLNDVLASASNGEAGELWNSLKEARRAYVSASGKDAEEKRRDAISTILWLIDEGYQEWQSWKDIRFMLQERRQLVESERKRLVDMQQMITAERANVMLLRIQDIIRTHVRDSDTLQSIAEEFRVLSLGESR